MTLSRQSNDSRSPHAASHSTITLFSPPKPSGTASGLAGSRIQLLPSITNLYSCRPSGSISVVSDQRSPPIFSSSSAPAAGVAAQAVNVPVTHTVCAVPFTYSNVCSLQGGPASGKPTSGGAASGTPPSALLLHDPPLTPEVPLAQLQLPPPLTP